MGKRNKKRNLGPVLVSFTAIFAVIGMIVETLMILFGYDANMRVFKLGSSIASASVAVMFILSIATISLAICVGKLGKMRSKARESGVADIMAALGGFAMMAASGLFLAESWNSVGALKIFSILLLVISIPAALSFFLGTEKENRLTTALAFFPPIWNAVCLVRLYFDSETAINDPVRILLQITLVAVMLALTYDLKLRVKESGNIMFTVTAPLATVLSCSSFMSVMLLFVIVKVGSVADLLLSVGVLLVSLYLLIRLSGYYKLMKERD